METYEWVGFSTRRWAVSILRFGYYLTGVLTLLMFLLPFYAWIVYLKPHFGYLLSGSDSIYVALLAVIYGVSFLILTAVLIVLHSLGERFLLQD